jgi:hypothetical protein
MSGSPQRFSAIWGIHLFAPLHRFCHEPGLRQLASKLLFRKDIRVSVFWHSARPERRMGRTASTLTMTPPVGKLGLVAFLVFVLPSASALRERRRGILREFAPA